VYMYVRVCVRVCVYMYVRVCVSKLVFIFTSLRVFPLNEGQL